MSKIHVLDYVNGQYRCVVHWPIPVGTNSAGFQWSVVLIISGRGGTTTLQVGTGPGQMSAEERDQIKDGTLVEFLIPVAGPPNLSGAQLLAALNTTAPPIIDAQMAQWAQELMWYGATQT